ncbi:acyl-CoA N-acyltransferase [Ilyonectria destructans]|nr:acyl-CoA N-acyltransferase [Ilyonectria destructans]
MTASSHTTNPKTVGAATIRDACAADATAIAELGSHVFTATFAHSVQPHELQQFLEESYTTAAVAKDMEDPSRDIIVATSPDDEIIGFAYLTRGSSEPCIADVKNTVELQRIYVRPSAQGQGIGGLLAHKLESMAREQGFEKIWLGVWEENHKAIRAYQKWGYEQVGDHDFAIGPVIQTDYIMLKDL